MIPIRDNIPARSFPVVTVTIIALNVIAFLLDMATGHRVTEPALYRGREVLVEHFEGGLSAHYSMIPALVLRDPSRFGLTLFTAMFLHANWLHIGGNMLYLWVFGNNVEDALGKARFALFYLICGAAAAITHIASSPGSQIPTLGASGAVAGVMGAYLILWPNARILSLVPLGFFSTLTEVPAILVLGFWIVLQVVNAQWLGGDMQGGGVAYFAHIGGFAAGMVLILLLGGKRLIPTEPGSWRGRRVDWDE